jgi:hypothetical protein
MFDKKGIKITRGLTVLWTKPKSVTLVRDGAAEVRIVRCTDQSDLGATINGEPLPAAYRKPVIQTVDVYRYPDGHWRIGAYGNLDKRCEP